MLVVTLLSRERNRRALANNNAKDEISRRNLKVVIHFKNEKKSI